MNQGGQLPDMYKFPPMDLQSYDDWKKEAVDGCDDKDGDDDVPEFLFMMEAQPTNPEQQPPEPEPDYSDSDSDHVTESELNTAVKETNEPDVTEARLSSLSDDECDKFVSAVEAKLSVNIPEPDYQDDDEEEENQVPNGNSPLESPYDMPRIFMPVEGNESELIMPKKLPNPCLESREKKDLHRELLMNKKLGVDVLHKKSELKKKLDERRDARKKKEQEELLRNKRTSLEVRLEEQANKLKEIEDSKKHKDPLPSQDETSEFIKVHSKIKRTPVDS